jgi:hypothetical protein
VAVDLQPTKVNAPATTHLHKIANALTQIIQEDAMEAIARRHLEELIKWILVKAVNEKEEDCELLRMFPVRL